MKNEVSTKNLFDLIRPPFKAVLNNGFILDQNDKIVSRIPALFSTHFEGELTDKLHCWIVNAMNEKWEREKPHDLEEPVKCISCGYILEQNEFYRCKKRHIAVDPYVKEPCEFYKKG
jgi:hypothetical protein